MPTASYSVPMGDNGVITHNVVYGEPTYRYMSPIQYLREALPDMPPPRQFPPHKHTLILQDEHLLTQHSLVATVIHLKINKSLYNHG